MSDDDEAFEEGIDLEGFQAGLQTFGAALLAAVATFLVVTIVVTEVLADEIEFSLLAGIPAGFIAALLVGGGIYVAASRRRPRPAQLAASIVMGFAAGFLIAYFVAVVVLEFPMVESMAGAIIIGVLVAISSFVRN